MALIVLRLAEVDRARVVERKSLCPRSRQIMERSVQSCRLTDDNSLSFDVFRNEIPFEIPPPPSRGMVSLMVSNQRIYTRSESRLERGSSNRKLGRGRHNRLSRDYGFAGFTPLDSSRRLCFMRFKTSSLAGRRGYLLDSCWARKLFSVIELKWI